MSGCLWCDEPSVRLCDFSLGHVPSPEDGLIHIDGEHFTCDAPMCINHSNQVGHICARTHEDCDTIDMCPAHAGKSPPQWRDPRFAKHRAAAQQARDAVRASALRGRMRLVP